MTAPVIACIKVGEKFGPEYVNRLGAAIWRHHPGPPPRFLCLTDDPAGVEYPTAPIDTDLPGAWAQLALFRPHPALEGRRVLYLDLDTVVVGSLAPLLAYDGEFAIVRDPWPPRAWNARHTRPLWTSWCMSIAPGVGRELWGRIEADPARCARGLLGVRFFITEHMPADVNVDLWEDVAPGVLGSLKADKLHDGPGGFAAIQCHGRPKPHELPAHHWARRAWEGGGA
jgi:hypothetical protein